MDEIIELWNSFAKMKAYPDVIVESEYHRLLEVGVTEEMVIKGIENYREALSLPESMANHHPLAMFLRIYFRKSYADAVFDIKRYSKGGYTKPQSVKAHTPYVSPTPAHVATLEERRAIKEQMMQSDPKLRQRLGNNKKQST